MQVKRLSTMLVATALSVVVAAPAGAATVVTPADGATVSALPTFTFDFTKGFADIELSRTPDIQASGSHAGQFADRAAEVSGFVSGAKLTASDPIDGGAYYWHAQVSDDNDPANPTSTLGPWSSLRRITVKDEPPDFIGWIVGAALTKHTSACSSRVRLRGKVAYTDNDATPRVRFRVRVSSGGRLITDRELHLDHKDNFDATLCTRHRRLKITPRLVDRIGQVTRRGSRSLHVH
jgi:hypothetical protein